MKSGVRALLCAREVNASDASSVKKNTSSPTPGIMAKRGEVCSSLFIKLTAERKRGRVCADGEG